MGVIDTISKSFDNLKKKITGVADNSTSSSNAMAIQGGGKRSRSGRRRMRSGSKRSGSKRSGSKRSGSKRRSHKKRKSTKKVRFSKKNKIFTYKRK